LSNANRYRSFLLRKADALTAVSQFIVDQFREAGWVDLDAVTVVSSGADFRNAFDDQRCYTPQPPPHSVLRLLSAGVLAWRWKLDGHIRALRCLAACRDVLGDFEFSIAGDGPLQSELEIEVKNLHLETKVRLLGNVTDMRLYFSHTDAYLQFFENEGCSLALLEALSHGLPVVGSGKGGSGAILQGLDGVLVLDGTEAEVVEQFRHKVVLSGWLGSRSRYARPSLSNYSWDSVCEQYLKVFREC
jgi:glycosyltransferase involved in cell wall biosynthesis